MRRSAAITTGLGVGAGAADTGVRDDDDGTTSLGFDADGIVVRVVNLIGIF